MSLDHVAGDAVLRLCLEAPEKTDEVGDDSLTLLLLRIDRNTFDRVSTVTYNNPARSEKNFNKSQK